MLQRQLFYGADAGYRCMYPSKFKKEEEVQEEKRVSGKSELSLIQLILTV